MGNLPFVSEDGPKAVTQAFVAVQVASPLDLKPAMKMKSLHYNTSVISEVLMVVDQKRKQHTHSLVVDTRSERSDFGKPIGFLVCDASQCTL